MRNFDQLRGGHPPRDIYAELRGIEERGQRLKVKRKSWLRNLFGSASETESAAAGSL